MGGASLFGKKNDLRRSEPRLRQNDPRQIGARPCAQLAPDVGAMVVDRARRQAELVGDHLAGETGEDRGENLFLAVGKSLEGRLIAP